MGHPTSPGTTVRGPIGDPPRPRTPRGWHAPACTPPRWPIRIPQGGRIPALAPAQPAALLPAAADQPTISTTRRRPSGGLRTCQRSAAQTGCRPHGGNHFYGEPAHRWRRDLSGRFGAFLSVLEFGLAPRANPIRRVSLRSGDIGTSGSFRRGTRPARLVIVVSREPTFTTKPHRWIGPRNSGFPLLCGDGLKLPLLLFSLVHIVVVGSPTFRLSRFAENCSFRPMADLQFSTQPSAPYLKVPELSMFSTLLGRSETPRSTTTRWQRGSTAAARAAIGARASSAAEPAQDPRRTSSGS